MGVIDGEPPDNTGSETLNRYRYQAEVAMQYCITCAAGGDVKSVFVEHFEDILVEFEYEWCFMQVKSKNQNQGKWTLKRAKDGLKSLFRAFENVGEESGHKFSLLIEGVISNSEDILPKLTPSKDGVITENDIQEVADVIGCDIDDCRKFVDRLNVRPNQTPRQNITSQNLAILADHSNNVNFDEVKSAYKTTVNKLVEAMSVDPLGGEPFGKIQGTNGLEDRTPRDKHITKEDLQEELGFLLNGPYPLLERITQTDSEQPTDLEKKLLAGGATEKIVEDAKNRRADATHRTLEVENLGGFSEEHIEDVEQRVTTLVNSIVVKHLGKEKTANHAWAESLERMPKEAEDIDPNRVYRRDPMTLIGVACDLTDKCDIDWGKEIE
ncbi:hypothetical protein GGP55_003064 [Salinibacter ruber]|uniref:DUF4297 domain-containing protein n=1 Tax=Salinibacter ruber TaxID=146919 RepID=UPI0021685666|nr:DUF4297 domain-containing protein [Salinibacter ruber]MCS3632447.1 hypothetical protein [Salinibacter ruber]